MSESSGRDGGGGRGGGRHPPAKQAVWPLTPRPLFQPLRILIGREAAGRYPAHPTCASGGALATGWEPSVRGPPWMAVRRVRFLDLGVLNVCGGAAILCCEGLPHAHFMLGAASPKCDNRKVLQILPKVPWWALPTHPAFENLRSKAGHRCTQTVPPGAGLRGLAWEGEGGEGWPRSGPSWGGLSAPSCLYFLWHRVPFISATFGPWSGMGKAGVTSVAQTQAGPLSLCEPELIRPVTGRCQLQCQYCLCPGLCWAVSLFKAVVEVEAIGGRGLYYP